MSSVTPPPLVTIIARSHSVCLFQLSRCDWWLLQSSAQHQATEVFFVRRLLSDIRKNWDAASPETTVSSSGCWEYCTH